MRKFDQKLSEIQNEVSILNEVDTTHGVGSFFGSLVQGMQRGKPFGGPPAYKPENEYVLLGGFKTLPKLKEDLKLNTTTPTAIFDPKLIARNDILVGKAPLKGLYAVKSLPNPNQVEVYLYSPKTKVRQVASRTLVKDRTQFAGYYDETSYDPTNELEALPQSPKISKKVFNIDGSINPENTPILATAIYNALQADARTNPKAPSFTIHELMTGELTGKNEYKVKFVISAANIPEDKAHNAVMSYLQKNTKNIAYMTPDQKAEVAKGSLLKQAGSAISQGVMNTAKQLGSEIAQQATTGSINYT